MSEQEKPAYRYLLNGLRRLVIKVVDILYLLLDIKFYIDII